MGSMLGDLKLKEPYFEAKLQLEWENIVGSLIARHTIKIQVKAKVLSLQIDSAPYRQEVVFQQQTIIARVNDFLGEDYIETIKVY